MVLILSICCLLYTSETDSFLLSEDESLVSPPLPSLPPLPSVLEEFVDETEVQPMSSIMTEEDKVEQCGENMLTPSQERLAAVSYTHLYRPNVGSNVLVSNRILCIN